MPPTPEQLTAAYRDIAEKLHLVPRVDQLEGIVKGALMRYTGDDSLAPIMVEKLRFSYTQVFETIYPEYAAANGDVLPIDTRVPPGADEWEYFLIDELGYADWIGDDGTIMPSGSLQAKRFKGRMAEMGHKYDVTILELERAAFAGVQISTLKQNNSRRVHEAKTNWTWLFGDNDKGLQGLVNHPNIQVSIAPEAAAQPFGAGDARNRAIQAKTVDEIIADFETLIELIPRSTIRAHFAARVFLPYTDFSHLRRRRLGAGDADMSVWDYIRNNFGTAEGETPGVEFRVLNECDADFRQEPVTQADQSGITGKFWLAIPAPNVENLAFIRARPYTQRPPQETDLKLSHITHSKIGGCKVQIPLAVHRLDFLTNSTAAS